MVSKKICHFDYDLYILYKYFIMKTGLKNGCFVLMVVVLYLLLFVTTCLHVPTNMFLTSLPPFVIVGFLLWKSPMWAKAVVAIYFVAVAVYVLFHNDIMGPMEFEINDRPLNVPGQFNYSWRYFWVMAYIYEVSWIWGVPSLIFSVIIKLYLFCKKN